MKSPRAAFTLVELLCVLAIISVLTAVVVPALTTVSDSDNVTNASYTISGQLQRARAYAISHNTYVWVGFYEEAADAPTPTKVQPPYAGAGRVIIGTVASVDGTQILADNAAPKSLGQVPTVTTPAPLLQIDPLIRVKNIHLTDLGAPSAGTTPLSKRPNGAYIDSTGSTSSSQQYGIDSDNGNATPYPFTVGAYTFYKTIRFSPSGEASININGVSALRRVGEIGLRPTHGDTINLNTPNVVAIQFTGIGGGFQTYRN